MAVLSAIRHLFDPLGLIVIMESATAGKTYIMDTTVPVQDSKLILRFMLIYDIALKETRLV